MPPTELHPSVDRSRFRTEPPPELLAAIQEARTVLCISHVGPDGDAIGSLTGLGWLLQALGKAPTLALADPVPEDFHFVPGQERIVGPDGVGPVYDLAICVDASSPDRMGPVYRPQVHSRFPLAVIDHHVTNTFFGQIHWVDPSAAATCQMLATLAQALDVPLAGPLAECLLTGLVTDTLGFRTSNTDTRVLATAIQLMEGGADLNQIVNMTLRRRPFAMVRLWSMVLPTVTLEEGVIWVVIRQSQREAAGVPENASPGLAGFLVEVREADISATFTERVRENGQVEVECSFRAKPGFDVSQVAFAFGGGGHPPAAGCTLPGSPDQVVPQVVAALQALRRSQLAQEEQAYP